jgi:tetratricopeptide (TPR) repeat protein
MDPLASSSSRGALERYRYLSLVWPLLGWTLAGHPCLGREFEAVVRVETASRVVIRSAPEVLPETVLTVVDRGAEFLLVGEEGDWFQIRLPDGGTGWMHRALATRFDWIPVGETALSLVEEPHEDASGVGAVGEGERLLILQRAPDWARVRGSDGGEGWVRRDLLVPLVGYSEVEGVTGVATSVAEAEEAEDDYRLGLDLVDAGRRSEALDAFTRAVVENPAAPEPHLQLARLLEEEGRLDEALERYRHVVHLGAGGPEIERRIGDLERRTALRAAPAAPEPPPLSPSRETPAGPREGPAGLGAPYLPAVGVGVLLVAAAAGLWIYRRRRLRHIESTLRLSKAIDEGMRAASAGRLGEILRQSEDRVKRIDRKLQERFRLLKSVLKDGPAPAGDAPEGPLGKVEELRELVLRQQSQIEAMSGLLELQTEKLSTLEEESRLLRELVRKS